MSNFVTSPSAWFNKYLTDRAIDPVYAASKGWRLLDSDSTVLAELLSGTERAERVQAAMLIPGGRTRLMRPIWHLTIDASECPCSKPNCSSIWRHLYTKIGREKVWTDKADIPASVLALVKEQKFHTPKDGGVLIYRPGRPDGCTTFYIVEGETRALALSQLGLWAAAIPGASMWHRKGESILHPDLLADVESATKIVVIYDCDVDRNETVQIQLNKLLAALPAEKSAVAYFDGEEKQGLDDILGKLTPENRRHYVESLQTSPAPLGEALKAIRDESTWEDNQPVLDELATLRLLRRCWDLPLFGHKDKETDSYIKGYEDYRKGVNSSVVHPNPRCSIRSRILELMSAYFVPASQWRWAITSDGMGLYRRSSTNLLIPVADTAGLATDFHTWASDIMGTDAPAVEIKNLVDTFMLASSARIDAPRPWRFIGDVSPATHEVPAPKEGSTPAWNEFLSRLSDADSFLAWVWSIVEEKHKGRQALWLHGSEGRDGKTTVRDVLDQMMGSLHSEFSDWQESNPHTAAKLVGKRFISKDDVKNVNLAKNSLFRGVVSGGTRLINPKHKDPRNIYIYARVLLTSNVMPEVSSDGTSESSRLLIVRVAPSSTTSDPTWAARLTKELPALLFRAREAYNRLCLNHGDLQITPATAKIHKELVSAESDRWATLNERLTFGEDKRSTAGELQQLLKMGLGLNDWQIRDAQAYLRSRPGITRKKLRRGTHSYQGWVGFAVSNIIYSDAEVDTVTGPAVPAMTAASGPIVFEDEDLPGEPQTDDDLIDDFEEPDYRRTKGGPQ